MLMWTIVIFILVLSFLVVAHEFGHFIVARKSGMKVYEFGIGFPPRAGGIYRDPKTKKWRFISGKGKSRLAETVGGEQRIEEFPATLYSINWLPLGGFVKIKGENGEDAGERDSFGYQKTWKKLATLVAGVTMNFLVAAVLLGIGFMIGLPTDVSRGIPEGGILIEEPKVFIQSVVADSPAEKAGIKAGDIVTMIGEERVLGSMQLTEIVHERAGTKLTLSLERATETLEIAVMSEVLEGEFGSDGRARLGVLLADAGVIRFPWYSALEKGFIAAFSGLIAVFVGLYLLLKTLIFGGGMAFDVAGPVGIAAIVGNSARQGINHLIQVTAMISLSLAAINILPIPALDGGRALFVIIEKLTGRKVPLKYEQLAHTIGFVLLMLLIVFVTFKDVMGIVK